MMALEGKQLGPETCARAHAHNSISLENQSTHGVESGGRLRAGALPWGVSPGGAEEGPVSPQCEATGHTNLFFNLFSFSSEHHLRQTAQENKPHFGSSQPSSISKRS